MSPEAGSFRKIWLEMGIPLSSGPSAGDTELRESKGAFFLFKPEQQEWLPDWWLVTLEEEKKPPRNFFLRLWWAPSYLIAVCLEERARVAIKEAEEIFPDTRTNWRVQLMSFFPLCREEQNLRRVLADPRVQLKQQDREKLQGLLDEIVLLQNNG